MSGSMSLLYTGRIRSVKFVLTGDDDVAAAAAVRVQTHEMYQGDKPYSGGVCDGAMGTVDDQRCLTCGNGKRACIGHQGEFVLSYPVYNPMAWEMVAKWLKVICHNCGESVISDLKLSKIPKRQRLQKIGADAKGKNKTCPKCGVKHPIIRHDEIHKMLFLGDIFGDEKKPLETRKLYPADVGRIFQRASDATVAKFGIDPLAHPRNYVITRIPVPANVIRPDVRKMGTQSSTDDITTTLQNIVRNNAKLPREMPQNIGDKLEQLIFSINADLYAISRASGEGSMSSIANRYKGKQGLIRRNQLGKRVRNMCRSTIMGDPTITIDEVGIPLVFAQTIQIEEEVQEWNKAFLMTLVHNGRNYPGATKVRKRMTGVEYDIDPSREIEVEIGDTIMRDVLDGDAVGFNRQPSLAHSAISAHKVRVTRNPRIKTLRMNTIACKFFGADFDGDAMNIIAAPGIAGRNELSQMSALSNWLIGHTNSAPSAGQVDDSIIGCAEMTRSGVMLSKYHAMMLFQHAMFIPNFEDVGEDGISGRECVSKLLERTPINYTAVPEYYKPDMAQFIKYDPTEIKVVIDQGRLLSGVLDKKSIGGGARGNIYHIIANEYSNTAALETMYNMQRMAIGFVMHSGFTIGIMDVMLPQATRDIINKRTSDMVNKSRLITERLINGEIIPPIGGTVKQFYEEAQINTLKVTDDFTDPILSSINPRTNNLLKLILFGSKGKVEQLVNMVSSGGQKQINGERIREKFGPKRTLPYFPRCDTSPESRGFIANSFIAGMNPSEYIFNAMAARFDLISKALTTASTGHQTRKSVLSMLSVITNNHRMAVKNRAIVQLAYGEDYLDPRKIEYVKFNTAMMSDKDFAALEHKDFPKFHQRMREDRETYRKYFINLEQMSVRDLMTADRGVAVNVPRILTDTMREHEASPTFNAQKLAECVAYVEQFCDNLPYVFQNGIREKARSYIPPYQRSACWLMQMLIRATMHPNALAQHKPAMPVLEIICKKIKLRYMQALIEPGTAVGCIAAQSYSEPLTQYMLDAHHRSATGGTSNNVMTRATDILAIKDTENLSASNMMIPVLPEFASDKARVQEIANNIESMHFAQFIYGWQIFYEKFAEPKHSQYLAERNIIVDWMKNNPLMQPPSDLVRWCIRFELSKQALILKQMSMDIIIAKLRLSYPDMYFVYTQETSQTVFIRVYVRQVVFKREHGLKDIQAIRTQCMQTIIRGVEGITNARVVDMIRNKIAPDGSITRATNEWGIMTTGTNLAGVLRCRMVDRLRVFTTAIPEMCAMFGIASGVQRVISGLREIVSTQQRHYLMYATVMAYEGYMTGIEMGGVKKRDASSVLLRMGFAHAPVTLKEAAINAVEDTISGVIAPLMIGSIPKHGTLYNSFHVNPAVIRANTRQPADIIREGLLA